MSNITYSFSKNPFNDHDILKIHIDVNKLSYDVWRSICAWSYLSYDEPQKTIFEFAIMAHTLKVKNLLTSYGFNEL